jgi:hypothetical protein
MRGEFTEGEIKEVSYWWPRPSSDTPLGKQTFYTKVGDQICGFGYYKGLNEATNSQVTISSQAATPCLS